MVVVIERGAYLIYQKAVLLGKKEEEPDWTYGTVIPLKILMRP